MSNKKCLPWMLVLLPPFIRAGKEGGSWNYLCGEDRAGHQVGAFLSLGSCPVLPLPVLRSHSFTLSEEPLGLLGTREGEGSGWLGDPQARACWEGGGARIHPGLPQEGLSRKGGSQLSQPQECPEGPLSPRQARRWGSSGKPRSTPAPSPQKQTRSRKVFLVSAHLLVARTPLCPS